MKLKRAFVLLSGGIDSTTCLYMALSEFGSQNVIAYGVDYGQRHSKEIDAATKICAQTRVKYRTTMMYSPSSMLTNEDADIPDVSYDELPEGISPTYVPFRNGTMLSLLTMKAQEWVMIMEDKSLTGSLFPVQAEATLFFGAHAEDAARDAYPDCSPEFIGSIASAIQIGTYGKVRLRAPLTYMTKRDVILAGDVLGARYDLTWSCYKGEEKHCGVCPTCRARKQAFISAGVADPTEYAA